ncbi:dienelactone hydrolase family protein [Bradyrhizobium sp. sBnM-33]|uniref:dienelactone hydrolase family protein n=1 Tax=Bradyrhizobium sp. sBnM-33 TaxID=2831780 RepID=UPI001BCF8BF3|nr:dienelactone hydrolase family protein [Bradyrhizobium sp. sBnM-33]WOH49841.1 dienelactone hydrolase family protein [Bradyrhizobium sp. sBnM-33]
MTNFAKTVALLAALLTGSAAECLAAESSATYVEIENPLASPHPLQGYLRRTKAAGPSPAVVLLHSCHGNWKRIDERWGKRIASWGYVVLTVDSLGPRGLEICDDRARIDSAGDAYRALNFLVRDPFVDPDRVAVIGFANGGRAALMSVDHGFLEQSSPNKFRASVAFYPSCLGLKGEMTVPALILIGELDDWASAKECLSMVEGRDDWGISRQKDKGVPIKLTVFPGAYHAFDAPQLTTPLVLKGHHLEFNQAAADQSRETLRDFLDTTIGKGAQ